MAKKTTTKKTSNTTSKKTKEVTEQAPVEQQKTVATVERKPAAKKSPAQKKQGQQIDGDIEEIFFNFTDRGVADEFRADLVETGIPAQCISIKKIIDTGNYKMTITDGQHQIANVVKLLVSKKYGLSLEDIQELLGIKITI